MPEPYQLFPALADDQYEALKADIALRGVMVAVEKDENGTVLDGHHRVKICEELGIKNYPQNTVWTLDEAEKIDRVVTLNLTRRRQLTVDQRIELCIKLRKLGWSYRRIAEKVGVSYEQVRRDLSGVTDVTPERVEGSDGKAYQATRPPPVIHTFTSKQAERAEEAARALGEDVPTKEFELKRAERMRREREATERRQEPIEPVTAIDSVEIRHGDFRQVLDDLKPGSVDAIITDPPYVAEFWDDPAEPFYELGELACRVLQPNGVLAIMSGTRLEMIDTIELQVGASMSRRWRSVYLVPGPRWRDQNKRVATGYKPILIFSHPGATDLHWINDDVFGSGGDDKAHHHWGQSESGMASLVERLSPAGGMVLDPFLGGGTTALVCRDLGRQFIGCDIDAAAVATARERIA